MGSITDILETFSEQITAFLAYKLKLFENSSGH